MNEEARQKLLTTLRELAKLGDAEVAHGKADDALLDYINDEEVRQAYDAIDKWYA